MTRETEGERILFLLIEFQLLNQGTQEEPYQHLLCQNGTLEEDDKVCINGERKQRLDYCASNNCISSSIDLYGTYEAL